MRVMGKSNSTNSGSKDKSARLESVGPNKTIYRLKTPLIPLDLSIEGENEDGFDPYNNTLGKTG